MLALNESWLYGKHQLKEGKAEIDSLFISIQSGELELFYQDSERDKVMEEICFIWNSGDYQVSEAIDKWLFLYF